jgi:hypothetical protein
VEQLKVAVSSARVTRFRAFTLLACSVIVLIINVAFGGNWTTSPTKLSPHEFEFYVVDLTSIAIGLSALLALGGIALWILPYRRPR